MAAVALTALTLMACADDAPGDASGDSFNDAGCAPFCFEPDTTPNGPGDESDAGDDTGGGNSGSDASDDSGNGEDPDTDEPDPICEEPVDNLFGDATCGGLQIFDYEYFGSICALAEAPVNTESPEAIDLRADYNALANVREQHSVQCATMAADVSSREAFLAWQIEGREALSRVLRLESERWLDLPLLTRVLDRQDFGTYERLHIDYVVAPDQRIPAYLYLPKSEGPHPAVIYVHGHDNAAKEASAGNPPYTESANYHRAGARALAEDGFLVLAPDVRSFGETGNWDQHIQFTNILHLEGRTAYGVFVADAMRAVDLLLGMEEVDRDRIAITGVSMGAMISVFTGALDPRIHAVSAHGILGELHEILLESKHDPCLYMANFDRLFDMADAAMMIAPRPAFYVTGAADALFPPDDVQDAFERVLAGYTLLDAQDLTGMYVHNGGHLYYHEPSTEFLQQQFGMP